ncbi:hypothetical protein CASFOL_016495 [Castilleja foliolosa]|uniref:(S)-ureidoglycine aminohydrolase cupin domain-containing protein n=1 Tax=Castilleja foliolosa TaxID=1961234 RepID=A0ABD3DIM2_9LAMI
MATFGTSGAYFSANPNFIKTVTKHPVGFSWVSTKARRPINTQMIMEIDQLGIKIVKSPPDSKLSDLGVRSWPKWGCPPSKFPWTYSSKETCYLLEGKVKVYPDGSDVAVEISAGDLVVFPKGMSCTWDVSVAVDKHYKFE